jgi:hypothetical protein
MMEREPCSVIGLMRSTRPSNVRSPKPSTRKVTAWPTRTEGTSEAGAGASISMMPRSTSWNSGLSTPTFSPGFTIFFATMPAKGAWTSASAIAFCAMRSWAWAERMLASAASYTLCVVSYAFCEMNFWRSSCWLFSRFFSAMSSLARASARVAACESSFACRSRVSICAMTWP